MFARSLDEIVGVIESQLLDPFIKFLIALAALVFIWGVIQFIASGGNPETQSTGRRHIVWGIIGLVIMVGALGILNLVASIFKF